MIKHVMQETANGCTLACVAMVTGRSFKEIRDLTGQDSLRAFDELLVLSALGYVGVPENDPRRVFPDPGVYIATVPSLNKVGGLHCVVFDFVDDFYVLDPLRGVGNKRWYTECDDPPTVFSEPIRAWNELVRVYRNPYYDNVMKEMC